MAREQFITSHSVKTPPNGTVADVTSSTMSYLTRLVGFGLTANEVLKTSRSILNDWEYFFAHFDSDVTPTFGELEGSYVTSLTTNSNAKPPEFPKDYMKVPDNVDYRLKYNQSFIGSPEQLATCSLLREYIINQFSVLDKFLLDKKEKFRMMEPFFMMNNHNFILRGLTDSNMLFFVCFQNVLGKEYIQQRTKNFEEFKGQFLREFQDKCNSYTMNAKLELIRKVSDGTSSELKNESRELIKSKFRGFIDSFEEVLQQSKELFIADEILRKDVRDAIKKVMGEVYQRFYNRFEISGYMDMIYLLFVLFHL